MKSRSRSGAPKASGKAERGDPERAPHPFPLSSLTRGGLLAPSCVAGSAHKSRSQEGCLWGAPDSQRCGSVLNTSGSHPPGLYGPDPRSALPGTLFIQSQKFPGYLNTQVATPNAGDPKRSQACVAPVLRESPEAAGEVNAGQGPQGSL